MIATNGFLAALECTKFVFGLGFAPDPAAGAYGAPPEPLAGLKRPTSKGGSESERGNERGRGKEGKGTGPYYANSWIRPDSEPLLNVNVYRNFGLKIPGCYWDI